MNTKKSLLNKTPLHIAIIMDGNTRWSQQRDLDSYQGHKAGLEQLAELLGFFQEYPQVKIITVFAFSSENWQRPQKEVGALISLFLYSLKKYHQVLIKNNIRLRIIGERCNFSQRMRRMIDSVEQDTKDGEFTLAIAFDYGGRWDIVKTAQKLAQMSVEGSISPQNINEELFNTHISLGELPEPDLMIRTGAEQRISNFLLWQLAYTELYFVDCYWPDFDKRWLRKALATYYRRNRRYGARGYSREYRALNTNYNESREAAYPLEEPQLTSDSIP